VSRLYSQHLRREVSIKNLLFFFRWGAKLNGIYGANTLYTKNEEEKSLFYGAKRIFLLIKHEKQDYFKKGALTPQPFHFKVPILKRNQRASTLLNQ
jgi:hypothetical protein